MSPSASPKSNTPSKVHFTEYIVTEDQLREFRHVSLSTRSKHTDVIRTHKVPTKRVLIRKAMASFFMPKDRGRKAIKKPKTK